MTIRTILLPCLIPLTLIARDAPQPGPHVLKDPQKYFRLDGTQTVDDRAVGLLDKGELSNLLTNYGIIADFHLGTPALHWPRDGADVQHYGFGVDLIMVADGKVISSIYDPSSSQLDFGWEAMDGSAGTYYNAQRLPSNTASDGVTPFMASSDSRDTWPVVGGGATWPGYFRENLENPGQYIEGEFVSDRDIYGVFRDDYDMGLVVKQTAYSYGRPYAEDFLFMRFVVLNQGPTDYDSCYVGFQADLKPDFYADDFIQYWTIEPYDQNPSFFYKRDWDGVPERTDSTLFGELWIGPVGQVGIGMVDAPRDLGVTSFHFFHDDYSPVEDSYFQAILENDTSANLENLGRYFHGSDPAFDDPALWYEVDDNSFPGTEITFIFGSGPFALASGDSVDFAIVLAIGADSLNLRDNVEMAYWMAKERSFQGSGPPLVPNITAVPGNGQVQIYWDSRAEASIDAISGQADFEGYRLYKSTDGGLTWGEPITNYYGDVCGWAPLAQFDVADSITGLDPAYGPDFPNANKLLGNDTGLLHAFTDFNVINGQGVWYCITAYDRGVFIPDSLELTEPSYENAIGVSRFDANIAVVTPGTPAGNANPGGASAFTELGGLVADGTLEMVIVDPSQLLDRTYQITFNDPGDTVYVGPDTVVAEILSMNLQDLTAETFYFQDALSGEEFYYQNIPLSGDDLPIVNGFRLIVENIAVAGVREMGWTTHVGDSCTFDWWTEDRHPNNNQSFDEVVQGLDDWRIIVTDDSVQVSAGDFIPHPDSLLWVPLRVERAVYDSGGIWVDATPYMWISDLKLYFTTSTGVGPYGWNLVPGGPGYNPNPNTGTLWPDRLILQDDPVDSTGSLLWLKTQNGDSTAIPPSVGDVFTIITYKPFHSGLAYEFTTQATTTSAQGADLSQIKVVPNPLIVSSGLETNPFETKVMFTHLPGACEISIYTVSGNRVTTLHHQSANNEGFTYWDVRNHEGQNVAYGVYIYIVKTPGGDTTTGKLMVIR